MSKKSAIPLIIIFLFAAALTGLIIRYPLVRWQINALAIQLNLIEPQRHASCGEGPPIAAPINFDHAGSKFKCDFFITDDDFYTIKFGYYKEGTLDERRQMHKIAGGIDEQISAGIAPVVRGGPINVNYILSSYESNRTIRSGESSKLEISAGNGEYLLADITAAKLIQGKYSLVINNLADTPEMKNIKTFVLIEKHINYK